MEQHLLQMKSDDNRKHLRMSRECEKVVCADVALQFERKHKVKSCHNVSQVIVYPFVSWLVCRKKNALNFTFVFHSQQPHYGILCHLPRTSTDIERTQRLQRMLKKTIFWFGFLEIYVVERESVSVIR